MGLRHGGFVSLVICSLVGALVLLIPYLQLKRSLVQGDNLSSTRKETISGLGESTQPLPQDMVGNEFVARLKDPPHYRPRSSNLAKVMFHGFQHLVALAQGWRSQLQTSQSFSKDGCPLPEPILRNQPRF